MDGVEALRALGLPKTWQEAIESFRAEHGAGTSRWIAQEFGVSLRTAQRWLAGTQAPAVRGGRRNAVIRAANRARIAARLLRTKRNISVGKVKVRSKSDDRPQGTRAVGTHIIGGELRQDLLAVAELLDQGDWDSAADTLSDALLDAYSSATNGPRGGVSAAIYISDYPQGITLW